MDLLRIVKCRQTQFITRAVSFRNSRLHCVAEPLSVVREAIDSHGPFRSCPALSPSSVREGHTKADTGDSSQALFIIET